MILLPMNFLSRIHYNIFKLDLILANTAGGVKKPQVLNNLLIAIGGDAALPCLNLTPYTIPAPGLTEDIL